MTSFDRFASNVTTWASQLFLNFSTFFRESNAEPTNNQIFNVRKDVASWYSCLFGDFSLQVFRDIKSYVDFYILCVFNNQSILWNRVHFWIYLNKMFWRFRKISYDDWIWKFHELKCLKRCDEILVKQDGR